MTIRLLPGEEILKQGIGNHQVKIESVGGRLYLTNQRLIFKSHSFNRNVHDVGYSFENIINIMPRLFMNFFPIGFNIILFGGKLEKFFVGHHKDWIAEIEAKIS
jgi:hypothetical protein